MLQPRVPEPSRRPLRTGSMTCSHDLGGPFPRSKRLTASAAPSRRPENSATPRLRPRRMCRVGAVIPVAVSDCGGWVLVRALQQQGRAVGHVRDVVGLAIGGDAEARRMIRDSGRHVREALAGAVNLLNRAVLGVVGDIPARRTSSSPGCGTRCTASLRARDLGAAGCELTEDMCRAPSATGPA
jgi:hypothetical protein